MIRFISAAIRGIKAEWQSDGQWSVMGSAGAPLTMGGRKSMAGPMVSPETIMGLSTVWAATAATAQVISSLPCHLYERQSDGSDIRIEDEISEILFRRPNSLQTGVEFWESTMLQNMVRGNAYAERLTVGPRLVGLRPLLDCTPKRTDAGFQYEVRKDGKTRVLPADRVFHLRGFGAGDGLGLSVVRYGVQSFGAALAADQTASSVFSNALMPGGMLAMDQSLTPEQRIQLQTIVDTYAGSKRAGKTMILEHGMKWEKVQWNPEDVQLLQTRRFQVEEICRWFGIPPIIIGHASEGQTMWGTGVEAIMLSWLQTGINPILRRLEARLNSDLIPQERRRRWYFEFNREAMMQMDSAAKADFLSKMATSGTMTANERRAKLNLPKHADPAAEALLAQTALAPLKDLGKERA